MRKGSKRSGFWSTRKRPAAERFWEKVQKTGECWLWIGAVAIRGYGKFKPIASGPTVQAHRFVWEITFGPIPDGLFVCHHCDNPSCVRPAHLFLGTNNDNVADATEKMRISQGETHIWANHSDETVRLILKLHSQGLKNMHIAANLGMNRRTVDRIVLRQSRRKISDQFMASCPSPVKLDVNLPTPMGRDTPSLGQTVP